MASNTWKLNTKELDRIIKDADVNADKIVRKLAFKVAGYAKQNAPYVTTALRNSIYVRTSKQNDYAKASSAAKRANPKVETAELPPAKEGEAHIGPCVTYGARVEFGFVGTDSLGRVYKHRSSHPYLIPAFEQVRKEFENGTTYREMIDQSAGMDNDWLI